MLILHAIGLASQLQSIALESDTLSGSTLVLQDDLAALVSTVSDDAEALFEDAERVRTMALAHHNLLIAASAHADVLPIQLGALHSGEAAVRAILNDQSHGWHAQLSKIAGCCEIAIAITRSSESAAPTTAPAHAPATAGRDYLKARRAVRDQRLNKAANAEAARAHLQDVLSPMARGSTAGTDLRFLVERAQMDSFLAATTQAEASEQLDGLAVQATGPWPVYSFMEAA